MISKFNPLGNIWHFVLISLVGLVAGILLSTCIFLIRHPGILSGKKENKKPSLEKTELDPANQTPKNPPGLNKP